MSTNETEDDSSGVECPTCGQDDFNTAHAMRIHHAHAHDESIAKSEVECAWCGKEKQVRRSAAENQDRHYCDPDCKGAHIADRGTETECVWDGCEEIFKSDAGMKIHHKRIHGVSLSNKEVTCDRCGDTKTTDNWSYENNESHYCSKECRIAALTDKSGGTQTVECFWCGEELTRHSYRVEQQDKFFCTDDSANCYGEYLKTRTGEDSPLWVGVTTTNCKYCGDEIDVRPYNEDAVSFCRDKECRSNWWSEEFSGPDHPRWEQVEVPCANCGQTKYEKPSRVERNDRFFCDLDCRGEWRSEHIVGPDHWDWEGGPVPYGEGWTESKKEAIRESQNRECAGCGKHESQQSQRLAVHHIMKARSLIDASPEVRNGDDNLVALCTDCHPKWEKMAPLRPVTDDMGN